MHLSVDESFGNVFLEALATGLPIIAYDVPRTRWIIGDAGCFARSETTEDLTAAIRQALELGPRAVADERAQSFGWDSIARQYHDFFQHLCRSKRADQRVIPSSLSTTGA
jgi:glycosyltransferase involved in cell wall biosynthesis